MSDLRSSSQPAGVSIDALDDHVAYLFPREKNIWLWCLIAIAVGVVCVAAPSTGALEFLTAHRTKTIGAGVACIALAIAFGMIREGIDLYKDRLVAKIFLGPWTIRRHRDLTQPGQLRVAQPPSQSEKPSGNYCVYCEDLRLTGQFPQTWCEALRNDLLRTWTRLRGELATSASNAAPAVDFHPPESKTLIDSPPNGSGVVVTHEAAGTVISLPAIGWNLHSGGLAALAFVSASYPLVSMFARRDLAKPDSEGHWFWVVGPIAFGILLFLWALAIRARRGGIVLSGRQLLLLEHGPVFTKRREFSLDALREVRVGEHFLTMSHDSPFPVLQVFSTKGQKTALFAGRPDRELDWLASVLNAAVTGLSHHS